MLTHIKIDGFKSFQGFEMAFTPFTVVAGHNASGKSNLFDALRLLSATAGADHLKKAFAAVNRGDALEMFTQYADGSRAQQMCLEVELLLPPTVRDGWGREATLKFTRLRYVLHIGRHTNEYGGLELYVEHEQLENLKHKDDHWIDVQIPPDLQNRWRPPRTGRSVPYISTEKDAGLPSVGIHQDGSGGQKRKMPLDKATRSVLSSFDSVDFPHALAAKQEMLGWRFWQLNPEDLRAPTLKQDMADYISSSGRFLAAALYRIKQRSPEAMLGLEQTLRRFLPQVRRVDVIDDQVQQRFLIMLEDETGKRYSSQVLSEGTLRLLALCVLKYELSHQGLLCFEEPENGIHPARMADMAELLRDLSADFDDPDTVLNQVVVNTHSPVLIGFLQKWADWPALSIHIARMSSGTIDHDGRRQKILRTRISPVRHDAGQAVLFSDEERWTLSALRAYLQNTPLQQDTI